MSFVNEDNNNWWYLRIMSARNPNYKIISPTFNYFSVLTHSNICEKNDVMRGIASNNAIAHSYSCSNFCSGFQNEDTLYYLNLTFPDDICTYEKKTNALWKLTSQFYEKFGTEICCVFMHGKEIYIDPRHTPFHEHWKLKEYSCRIFALQNFYGNGRLIECLDSEKLKWDTFHLNHHGKIQMRIGGNLTLNNVRNSLISEFKQKNFILNCSNGIIYFDQRGIKGLQNKWKITKHFKEEFGERNVWNPRVICKHIK